VVARVIILAAASDGRAGVVVVVDVGRVRVPVLHKAVISSFLVSDKEKGPCICVALFVCIKLDW
jgi:hypothetical protein